MISVNLLPPAYVAMEAAHRRAAAWLRVSGVVMLVLASGSAAAAWALRPPETPAGERIAELEKQIAEQTASLSSVNARIKKTQVELQAAQAVGAHPDYSVLLERLAADRKDQVVLESVEVKTVSEALPLKAGASRTAKPVMRTEIQLELGGVATSPSAVPAYLLRLEHSGLFAKVTLTETSARPASATHKNELTAFRVKAVFNGEPVKAKSTDVGGTAPAAAMPAQSSATGTTPEGSK